MVSEEKVRKALRSVIDPEFGLDICSLGFIYGIEVKNDEVNVKMTLTSPTCPIANQLKNKAEKKVAGIRGVKKVKVDLVFDPPWTPERLSKKAKQKLGIA